MKLIAFNTTNTKLSENVWTVDLLYNAEYNYYAPEHTYASAEIESNEIHTISEYVCIEKIDDIYILRNRTDDEVKSLIVEEKYYMISQSYNNALKTSIRNVKLRDELFIPMLISIDDINMLEHGFKVLSFINDEENCFVKDNNNIVHKCSIQELGYVLEQCRFAHMLLWKHKVYLQSTLETLTLEQLRSLEWYLPENNQLEGSWI